MITPEEIREKAERLYSKFVKAWLAKDSFFPCLVPSSKELSGDIAKDIESVRILRAGSKEVRGYGYTVEWVKRRLRGAGRNEVPDQILFETQQDLLKLIGRDAEFSAFAVAVKKIRTAFPQLEKWIHSHVSLITSSADVVDGLIEVTQWFQANPRPNRFAREIPLNVHGKFIEQNSGILRQWFDAKGILDGHAIRADEPNFFRRYGLRDWEPLITVRCLDEAIQKRLRLPCSEAAVPIDHVNSISLNDVRIFVVENLTNLRTFPPVKNGLAVFGMGNAVVDLRALDCLQQNEVVYWGDLDVYGFRILSQYRQVVGRARSLFMDIETFHCFEHLMQPPSKAYKSLDVPSLLNQPEQQAFCECNNRQLQLEQERLPQHAVAEAVQHLLPKECG